MSSAVTEHFLGFASRFAGLGRQQALLENRLGRLRVLFASIETTLKYYIGLSTADIGADLYIYSNVPVNVPKKRTARKTPKKSDVETQ